MCVLNDFYSDFSSANVWPINEAKGLFQFIKKSGLGNKRIKFQTGYGPSGLPHIGTFGEVMRTTMVKHAFEKMCEIETELVCFSDDLDGLRKVPDNIPDKHIIAEDIDLPLSSVRDPFKTHASFADHNNSKLREFLDSFRFNYNFVSATDCYKKGDFNEALIQTLRKYDQIMEIMLPSLGDARRSTYSPFLPISQCSGKVLQVPTLEVDLKSHSIVYQDLDGKKVKTPVTDGNVKLQWKADWAMRWFALSINYEMYGKDLIPSASLATKICSVLGRQAPYQFFYELFLDDKGQKISKSKGNGISIDEWLRYGSKDSLSLFMFQKPKTAKRLYFDAIPRAVDDYHKHLKSFIDQEKDEKIKNPVWHIHEGDPPQSDLLVPFSMLMNLAGAIGSDSMDTLWSFIEKYLEIDNTKKTTAMSEAMINSINYFNDFLKPNRVFKKPSEPEKKALISLIETLSQMNTGAKGDEVQQAILDVGKENNYDNNRDWFKLIYEVMLGSQNGPRLGSFISLLGIGKTIETLKSRIYDP